MSLGPMSDLGITSHRINFPEAESHMARKRLEWQPLLHGQMAPRTALEARGTLLGM